MAIPPTYRGWRLTYGDATGRQLAILVPTDYRVVHFASAADEATDWNVANPTHPTFYVHSETTPATDYMAFSHNATSGFVNVASGSLALQIDGTTYMNLTATALTFTTVDVVIPSAAGLLVGSATQVTVSDGGGATNLIPEVQALGVGAAFAGGAIAAATFNTTNDRTVSPKLILVKGGAATQVATTALADNEVVGSIIAYGSDGTDFETPVGAIEFVVDDVGGPGTGAIGGSLEFYTTADGGETLTLAMTINAAQNVVINNGNGLLVGNATGVTGGALAEFQVLGTAQADSSILVGIWSADSTGASITTVKSRNTTIGSFSIVVNGDTLMYISAYADDGVDYATTAAEIYIQTDGDPGSNDMPGRLVLLTTPDGSTTSTERVRITNTGLIYLGNSATGRGWLGIDDASAMTNAGAADTAGASVYVQTQDGGAASGNNNGVAGGALELRTGDGVAPAGTGTTGGAAGDQTHVTGVGGAGSATGTGGRGGDVALTGGAGGATSGAGTGGRGGDIILTPGAGGTTSGGTAGAAGVVRLANGSRGLVIGTRNNFGTTQPTNVLQLFTGTSPVGAVTTSVALFTAGTVMSKIIADGTASNVET